MSKFTDLSRKRATFAYDQVVHAKATLGGAASEFKSHVKDIPMMIRTNGLAAAYAFAEAKAKVNDGGKAANDYELIVNLSNEWLCKKKILPAQATRGKFAVTLSNMEHQRYRMAIKELFALFTWLKRFSDAMIEKT